MTLPSSGPPTGSGRSRRIERILSRLFIGWVALVITVLMSDHASRLLLGDKRTGIEATYPVGFLRQPRPYTMFSGTAEAPFNDRGYPGKSFSGVKPLGAYRIFVLGGSTVVAGDPSIAELLELAFHRQGHSHVEVFNCGVVSSVSGQELSRIVFDISDHQPDLIVMYNGGNDMIEPVHYDPRPGYPFNFLLYENNPLLESDLGEYPTWTLLAYGSHLFRQLGTWRFTEKLGHLSETRAAAGWGTAEWETGIARHYVDHLLKAQKVSNGFGAEFIAFLQPVLAFKRPLVQEERARLERKPMETRTCLAVRQLIREMVQRGIDRESLAFFDLSDIYTGVSDMVFRDSIHTLQQAKPSVAGRMHTIITEQFGARIRATSQVAAAVPASP